MKTMLIAGVALIILGVGAIILICFACRQPKHLDPDGQD